MLRLLYNDPETMQRYAHCHWLAGAGIPDDSTDRAARL
jgi:hypothetical protein